MFIKNTGQPIILQSRCFLTTERRFLFINGRDSLDVVKVGPIHPLVRPDLCEILKEPKEYAINPHKTKYWHVGSQSFRQNSIGLRKGPENGQERRNSQCNDTTTEKNGCWTNLPEEERTSPRAEEGQEVRHWHFKVDSSCDLAVINSTNTDLWKETVGFVTGQEEPKEEQWRQTRYHTKDSTRDEKSGLVPLVGSFGRFSEVVCNGDERSVVQQSDQHKHQYWHVEILRPFLLGAFRRVINRVEGEDRNEEEQKQLKGCGYLNHVVEEQQTVVSWRRRYRQNGKNATTYSVGDKVADTGEDLSCNDDPMNDSAETLLSENNIGGGHGSISCTRNCNTDVSMLQGWSIVDTIASCTDRVSEVTERFNNQVLAKGLLVKCYMWRSAKKIRGRSNDEKLEFE